MDFPVTLLELTDRFPDDQSCWEYLKRVRWPRGFICPRCKGRRSSFIETRKLWQCSACRHQVSLTAGTVFQGTRTPLRKWFLAIFFMARHKQGISALQLQRDLGLGNYQTAWTMMHKLRSGLAKRPHQLLRGDVEADETYIGGARSGKRGRGAANKSMVAVAVERVPPNRAGSAYLAVIADGSAEELGATVRGPSRAEPGSSPTATGPTRRSSPAGSSTFPRSRAIQNALARSCRGSTRSSRTSRPGSSVPSAVSATAICRATSPSSATASIDAGLRNGSSST